MTEFLEKTFKLSEAGTTIRTEVRGGAVTFMTMAYIIFVQPVVLSQVGMDYGAVMVATCLSAAVATLLLGLTANYPFALAAAMGENFIFVSVCHKMAGPIQKKLISQGVAKDEAVKQALAQVWPIGLAVIFLAGTLFLALSVFKFRERIMRAIPESLRYAIATGIGLLIAFVGYSNAGFKLRGVAPPESLDTLRSCQILSIIGVAVIGILLVRKVRGAILIGMIATALIGIPLGVTTYAGGSPVQRPPSIAPTLFKLNFPGVFTLLGLEMVFIFFLLDLFDTVGTLVAVGNQAGFMKEDGELPRAGQAFLSDAVGTMTGAAMGTSTVTCYIESSSGVADGARTGLANVVTAALFVLAIFFKPVVQMVGGGVKVSEVDFLLPVIAPVLLIVGAAIMRAAAKINWEDYTEAIPSFLTVIIMPMKLSITEGISAGFIAYAVLKIAAGKGKEVDPVFYLFAAVFAVRGVLVIFGVIG